MSREDRAKQFAPFDALKGLQMALRKKEYEHECDVKNNKTIKIQQKPKVDES